MTKKETLITLVTLAGLDIQHRCSGCGSVLSAYGRKESDQWSCPDCALPGKRIAMKYNVKEGV
jgi:hypothetical protein